MGDSPLCEGAGKWRGGGGGGAGKPQPGRKGGAVRKGRFAGEVPIGGNEVGGAKEGARKEVPGVLQPVKGAAPGFSTYACPRNRLQAGFTPSPQFLAGGRRVL